MQKLKEFFTPPRLRVLNYVAYGLMAFGMILRFLVTAEEDSGIGRTPFLLFIVQFVVTYAFIAMLIMGEMHKPAAILLCFPLLMSRLGRGSIILMLSLPITNMLEIGTTMIMIICACIGIFNMILGWKDGPVELKWADEGVPDQETGTSTPPRANAYEMK